MNATFIPFRPERGRTARRIPEPVQCRPRRGLTAALPDRLKPHDRHHRRCPRQALHRNPRLPDERVRLGQDGRCARRQRRPGTDLERRGSRRHPDQHLLDPREGAGKGLQPARPLEIAQARRQAGGDRRRRLRGLAGRRGDHQARALRRSGVRPADPAPPARADQGQARNRPAAGRYQLPRDREVRPPARAARRGPQRLRLDHGRLQQVLLVLRGALHPRRGDQSSVRRRAGRSRRPRRAGRARSHPARPERQCLPRPVTEAKARSPTSAC